jgi:hypothetical protein
LPFLIVLAPELGFVPLKRRRGRSTRQRSPRTPHSSARIAFVIFAVNLRSYTGSLATPSTTPA